MPRDHADPSSRRTFSSLYTSSRLHRGCAGEAEPKVYSNRVVAWAVHGCSRTMDNETIFVMPLARDLPLGGLGGNGWKRAFHPEGVEGLFAISMFLR